MSARLGLLASRLSVLSDRGSSIISLQLVDLMISTLDYVSMMGRIINGDVAGTGAVALLGCFVFLALAQAFLCSRSLVCWQGTRAEHRRIACLHTRSVRQLVSARDFRWK